jgi:phosphoribosylamine--glycine ligase
MSRFLLLSDDGSGIGLALRLLAEGHDVRTWIKDPGSDEFGHGIIKNAESYEFCQNIIADSTNFGALLDAFRDCGAKTFGGSVFADKLEADRSFASQVMREADIDTPESISVTGWDEAVKAIKKIARLSDKIVIKPEGGLSGVVPSQIADDVDEGLSIIEILRTQNEVQNIKLTIQEYIDGIAVSTEGWFNGEEWIEGMFNHTLEKKATQNGDLGPTCGCAGNVVWRCAASDIVVKQSLLKLTESLREQRYTGPFDINCVVNKKGIYGLEFTPRFGYDAFPTLLYSLFDDDFGAFICSSLLSLQTDTSLRDGFGAGVRLMLPKDSPSARISFGSDLASFYPHGIMQDEDFFSVAKADHLGVVSKHGDTIGEAFARCYDICSRVKIKDLSYRTDLAQALLEDYRKLDEIFTGNDGGWYGVDLDGTLADYSDWSDEIGDPLPVSIQRVRRQLSEGKEVRVFTARGTVDGDEDSKHEQVIKIYEWIKKHVGVPLEVQHNKDPKMIRLDDDRVRQVDPKDGSLIHGVHSD